MSQRERAHQILTLAKAKAEAHGLDLTPFDDSYQYPEINLEFADRPYFRLSWSQAGRLIWAVDLWPSDGEFALVRWDQEHKGPALALPRFWTILDAVDAMIAAKDGLLKMSAGRKVRRRP